MDTNGMVHTTYAEFMRGTQSYILYTELIHEFKINTNFK